MAKAFRELGPAHFRLMRGLLQMSPFVEPPSSPEGLTQAMGMHPQATYQSVLNVEPLLVDTWDVLIAGLLRHGAVREVERTLEDPRFGFGGEGVAKQRLSPQAWRVTRLGAELYRRVLIAGRGDAKRQA